jgi:hypothetical protein
MDDNTSVNDAVDTTDCLEAIGAFKAMKNLFFMVVFISLIVLQGIFWLNHLGYIEVSKSSEGSSLKTDADFESSTDPNSGVVTDKDSIKKQDGNVVAGMGNDEKTADTDKVKKTSIGAFAKYMPNQQHADIAIRLCNFVLIISATIYCLILLMSIKISLVGRLGGIGHISRAFFLSLFALTILLPWQGLFEGVALGAIYLPAELFTNCILTDESTLIDKVMYFARFSGMWGISFLLLLVAQARSAKWSKTTLRRLGILR